MNTRAEAVRNLMAANLKATLETLVARYNENPGMLNYRRVVAVRRELAELY